MPGVLWVGIFRLGPIVADCWVNRQQEREEEGAADGQCEIHGRPCRCNERHVATWVAHGAGSIGTGFAQPKKNPPGINRQISGKMTVPNGSM